MIGRRGWVVGGWTAIVVGMEMAGMSLLGRKWRGGGFVADMGCMVRREVGMIERLCCRTIWISFCEGQPWSCGAHFWTT